MVWRLRPVSSARPSEEIAQFKAQLFSELRLHLWRQVEVLALEIKGTNFDKQVLRLLAPRLLPARDHSAAPQIREVIPSRAQAEG